MTFKELTEKDKAYVKTIHKNIDLPFSDRMDILKERFGVAERTVRKWIALLGYSKFKEVENEEIRHGKLREYNLKKKYFIFSWAQNATPVHKPLWNNILAYAKFLDAEVGIIQGRYQNPTSLFSESMKASEWWDESFSIKKDGLITSSYLDGSRSTIHYDLDVLADARIVPTASDPLARMGGMSGHRTAIVGHPRVHLQSLPVLDGWHKKVLLTTGACTVKNYSDTRSGKISEFNHTYGFVIVEIKDVDTFYIRQVTAESDGTFIDLIYKVDGEVTKVKDSAAFIMGDIHVDDLQEGIMEETLRFFKQVRPETVVLHDILNGSSVNHHESKDPIKQFEKIKAGRNIVRKEIDGVKDFIKKYKLTSFKLNVVRSNHDIWLDRWVSESDWKQNIVNSVEYMEYALLLLSGKAKKGLLPYLLEEEFGDKIHCLDLDESLKVLDWELGQHGHLGANGSKGNIEQYRKLSTKTVVGDFHAPARKDGCIGVGTYTKLRAGYNHGASAWNWAGTVIHNNGKAQLLIFNKEKFTTLF